MGTRASNSCCSDAMTLPINDWLFHIEGGTNPPYCALQFLPFISIGVNHLCISIVFVLSALSGYLKCTLLALFILQNVIE